MTASASSTALFVHLLALRVSIQLASSHYLLGTKNASFGKGISHLGMTAVFPWGGAGGNTRGCSTGGVSPCENKYFRCSAL